MASPSPSFDYHDDDDDHHTQHTQQTRNSRKSEDSNERLLKFIESNNKGGSFGVGGGGFGGQGDANSVDTARLLDLLEMDIGRKVGGHQGVVGAAAAAAGSGAIATHLTDSPSRQRRFSKNDCSVGSQGSNLDSSFTSALLGGNAEDDGGAAGQTQHNIMSSQKDSEIQFNLSDDNINNENASSNNTKRGDRNNNGLSGSFNSISSRISYNSNNNNNNHNDIRRISLDSAPTPNKASSSSSNNNPRNYYSDSNTRTPSSARQSFDNPFKNSFNGGGTSIKKNVGLKSSSSSSANKATASSSGLVTSYNPSSASGRNNSGSNKSSNAGKIMDVASGGDVAAGGIRQPVKQENHHHHVDNGDEEEDASKITNHDHDHDHTTTSSQSGLDPDGQSTHYSSSSEDHKSNNNNAGAASSMKNNPYIRSSGVKNRYRNTNNNNTLATLTSSSSTTSSYSAGGGGTTSTISSNRSKRHVKRNSVSFDENINNIHDTSTVAHTHSTGSGSDHEYDGDDNDEEDDDDDDGDYNNNNKNNNNNHGVDDSQSHGGISIFSLGSLGSTAVSASTHATGHSQLSHHSHHSHTTRSSRSSRGSSRHSDASSQYSQHSHGSHSTGSTNSALERRHRRELVPISTSKKSVGSGGTTVSGEGSSASGSCTVNSSGVYHGNTATTSNHKGGGRKGRRGKSSSGSKGSRGSGSSGSLSSLLSKDSQVVSGLHVRYPVRYPKGIDEEDEEDVEETEDEGDGTTNMRERRGRGEDDSQLHDDDDSNFLDGILSSSENSSGLFGRMNRNGGNNNTEGLYTSLLGNSAPLGHPTGGSSYQHRSKSAGGNNDDQSEVDGNSTADESSFLSNILNQHMMSNYTKQRKGGSKGGGGGGSVTSDTTGYTTSASTQDVTSSDVFSVDYQDTSKSSKRRGSDADNGLFWQRAELARRTLWSNIITSVTPSSPQNICNKLGQFYDNGGTVWPRSRKEWIQWGVFALLLLPIINVADIYITTSDSAQAAATNRYYGSEIQYLFGGGEGEKDALRGTKSVLRSSVVKSNAWAGSSQVMLSQSSSLGENMILMPDADWLELQIGRSQAIKSAGGTALLFGRGSSKRANLPKPPQRLPLPPILDPLYDSTNSMVLYFITASNGKDISENFDPANLLSISELNTQANTKLWKDIQTRLNPKPADVWPCWNHNSLSQFREDGFVLMYPMKRRVHAEKALRKLARDFGQSVFYEFITWTETQSQSDFGTGSVGSSAGDTINKASERASSIRRIGKDGSAIIIPALPGGATDVMIRTTISVRPRKDEDAEVPAVVMRRVKDLPIEDELTMREFEGPSEDEVVWT